MRKKNPIGLDKRKMRIRRLRNVELRHPDSNPIGLDKRMMRIQRLRNVELRHPDSNFVVITRRANNMRVGTLRETYGSDFAKGFRRDAKLSTVLESTGAGSLDEYVEHYKRALALAKATGTSTLSNTIISITSSHFEPALKNLAKK
jgi:hypothetical protein